jgi:outer membrane protein OmpA-like peptidoglycan-associated protein
MINTIRRPPAKLGIAVLLAAVFAAAPLYPQYRGFSLGLGGEANTVTVYDDFAIGIPFSLEGRLNRYFALCFSGSVSSPFSKLPDLGTDRTFWGMNTLLFIRFYLLSPKEMKTPRGLEVFLGAGGGLIITRNGQASEDSRGAPEAAAILGARLRIGEHFYVEPYVCYGLVSQFGGGLITGLRFPMKNIIEKVEVKVEVEKIKPFIRVIQMEDPEKPEVVDIAAPPPQTVKKTYTETPILTTGPPDAISAYNPPKTYIYTIIFGPDSHYFYNLDKETVRHNNEVMQNVTRLLSNYPSTRLQIKGYANPVYGTAQEEKLQLLPLSAQRALYIANMLVSAGISPERLIPAGEGGSNTIAAMDDRQNWSKNRRVELRIFWN